ncbi:hypothetical protein J1605_007545 [Eschrichtius robustus]|uniref:Uncharacterized protein n=1 Tax=Eschrichtius robustus TaxID=9764 RepID=A0AB34GZU9_ESCRO|nr:hypothetical protein J1605_007545 [Eschrichtius robustus]
MSKETRTLSAQRHLSLSREEDEDLPLRMNRSWDTSKHFASRSQTCRMTVNCFTVRLKIKPGVPGHQESSTSSPQQQDLNQGASLVAQWLRICLLMQGTRVRALVWEDPTCHGATGPVSHNY